MKVINTNEQTNILGGKVKCTACGRKWLTWTGYYLTAAVHNLKHLLKRQWFDVINCK